MAEYSLARAGRVRGASRFGPESHTGKTRSRSGEDVSKEHAWWVEMNARRLAAWREARELLCRRARFEAEYPESRGALAEWGQPPKPPPESCSSERIQRYVRRLRSHCLTTEGRLKRRRKELERRSRQQDETRSFLLAGFEAGPAATPEVDGLSEAPASDPEEAAAGPTGSPDAPPDALPGAAERDALRLMSRLSAEVPAAERGALEELAAGIDAEEHPARARTTLLELRLGVQRANDRAEKAKVEADRRLAEAVEDLREKIRGLSGEGVDEISAELDLVEQGRAPLDGGLPARVDAVAASATERSDREYVGEAMREELERLGYVVEEGFDSVFSEGGSTLLKKTGEEELGVVVDVAGNGIDVEPVRIAAAGRRSAAEGARRDEELESGWCRDFQEIREGMAGRGVPLRVGRRFPVGVRRLKVHEGEERAKERAAASRARRPRRRKLRARQEAP